MKPSLKREQLATNNARRLYLILKRNTRFGYLLESPQWGDSNKYPKHVFYEEIGTKQDFSYISICSLRILNNGKYILMAIPLGTNAVVVKRVYWIVKSTRIQLKEPQLQKTHHLTCAPNVDSNQPLHPRIAVWSESSLPAWRNFVALAIKSKWHQVNIMIGLCECTGWSRSPLGAHVRRYVFWHSGSR